MEHVNANKIMLVQLDFRVKHARFRVVKGSWSEREVSASPVQPYPDQRNN